MGEQGKQGRREIKTEGTYVEGSVHTAGGDLVGRDQVKIGTLVGNILFGNLDAERARRNRENREAMLQKVRHAWIEGVLGQSLYHVARIDLGLEEQPDAVTHPWDMIVQEQGRPPRDLPPGTRMGHVFDDLGGALLILGAPGSGKTTLLLELADELLDRAERDDGHRIPVVFNLSSWAVKRKSLVEWLVDELNERYDVPRKMGQAWVDADAILPLLDGLDEVARDHREDCAEAINAFRGDHGLIPLVVCSRLEEYEALAARLRLSGAILIQPMTREQVDGYLARAGRPLASVREALQADATLYELLDTPLMLSIVAMTNWRPSATAMQVSVTPEKRRRRLFEMYVEAMVKRRSTESRYPSVQTKRWLRWLAKRMVIHEQTVFYLERTQPDWLPKRTHQRLVTWGAGIAIVLVFGLAVGLGGALGGVLIGGLVFGLAVGLVFGLIGMLVGVLAVGLGEHTSDIQPVEAISWSWSRAQRMLAVGLVFGLAIGLAIGLGGGLVGGLGAGLVVGLTGVLVAGLVPRSLDRRTRPNQGIHRSARNGLFAGLVFGLAFGLSVGLGVGLVGGLVGGLMFGSIFGLMFGGRAWLQHSMLRLLLWRNDYAPPNYVRFLDYAAERILLRKVGGGYIFVHRMLMEHFARQWQE